MSKQLKLRRGTTAQHSTFTGAAGEITVDTTKKTLVVHDGVTPGGNPVLLAAASAVGASNIADSAITSSKIAPDAVTATHIAAGAVGSSEIATDAVTATQIAAGAVGTSELADANVTAAKLAAGASASNLGGYVSSVDGTTGAITLANLAAFTKSLSGNGYQKLPGGLILQWGRGQYPNAGWYTTTFPIAFPNACLTPIVIPELTGASSGTGINGAAISASSFQHFTWNNPTGVFFRWFAIGY